MSAIFGNPAPSASLACDRGTRVTRSLLGYGALAGPVYVAVVLGQALIRPGFDLSRHDASLLSNGSLGWVQVLNFIATGLMVVAFAVGVRRALGRGPAATWGPRLLAGFGMGMIGAGLFRADPMAGFPAGAPAGMPTTLTTGGILHIALASAGFLCFVAACFALGRRFAAEGERGWSRFSRVAGAAFLVAFVGLASGSGSPIVVVAFWIALIVAWAWLAGLAVRLYRTVSAGTGEPR